MKHAEGTFAGCAGIRIFWQSWRPDLPVRAAIVIVHGLGEHGGRYEHVAEMFVSLGCAAYAVDHRGHGRSGGHRADLDSWQYAIRDLDAVVDLARQECRGRPLYVLGHSMGGALSLAYAIANQQKLDGLMLSGPAISLDGAPPLIGPISKLLARVMPRLGLFGIDPSIVSRDPQAVQAYASDPLNCHGKVPVRTLNQIVRLTTYLGLRWGRLERPLLIQHGGDDKLAGVSGSRAVFEAAGSADKQLKVYDGLYHEIFNEMPPDRARVLRDLGAWLEQRLPVDLPAKQTRSDVDQ